ncbi:MULTISPECIES: hypothetical protein [unclassified Limnothrix]|uniref:hypothetical protein n=1 Tax=unclassified Limnothrix TaxID=2632864 RepID=UPI001F548A24|nr:MULTISPECIES: hypothetical protein [unclassified Limnothrix]
MDTARILREIEKVQKAIGVKDLPFNAPILNESAVGLTSMNSLVDIAEWQVKCLNSVLGSWPRKVPFIDEKGKKKDVEFLHLGHAIDELTQIALTTAEDADAAVNVASRAVVEAVNGKIAAFQATDWAKANAKFLGYAAVPKAEKVRLAVTPAAAGANNKLENQEMADFLKPSFRFYQSVECQEKHDLLSIAKRTLEDGEIARAALFRPLKPTMAGLTGESIREERKKGKRSDKQWKQFLEDMKRAGVVIKDKTTSGPKG